MDGLQYEIVPYGHYNSMKEICSAIKTVSQIIEIVTDGIEKIKEFVQAIGERLAEFFLKLGEDIREKWLPFFKRGYESVEMIQKYPENINQMLTDRRKRICKRRTEKMLNKHCRITESMYNKCINAK